MHTEPYAASTLADLSALLQSVIDAADAVVAAAVIVAAVVCSSNGSSRVSYAALC
jgi:hypothetical protein